MNLSLILFGILPLIAFVVIDSFMGLKAGLISAVVFAVAETIYSLYEFGSIDSVSIASLLLVFVFALLSLKFNNAIFMKLQPVFLGVSFGVVLLMMQVLDKPLLLMMLDKYHTFFPEEVRSNLAHPVMRDMLARTSLVLGFGFLLHAALVAYSAFRMSNWWWLFIRGVGLYVMMFLCVVIARFF